MVERTFFFHGTSYEERPGETSDSDRGKRRRQENTRECFAHTHSNACAFFVLCSNLPTNPVFCSTSRKDHLTSIYSSARVESAVTMYLQYYLDENNKRVYTFKKIDPNGCPTLPAHPARYSVLNEMSKERILIKKRFNILPTQGPPPVY